MSDEANKDKLLKIMAEERLEEVIAREDFRTKALQAENKRLREAIEYCLSTSLDKLVNGSMFTPESEYNTMCKQLRAALKGGE